MVVSLLIGAAGGCYDMGGAPPAAAPKHSGSSAVGEGSVHEVIDAAGRAFVALGEAHHAPEKRGAPTVIRKGVAVEFADERSVKEELPFTVVDAQGTCVTRAKARLMLGRHENEDARWLEAVELEGCRGDPALRRVAFAGAASAAQWINAQEAVYVDGELVQSSEFLEGEVDGKKVLRQFHVPGTDYVFELEYVAPPRGKIPLRMLRGKHLIETYPGATVAGAIGLVDRLLVVLDGGGTTVIEVVGDRAVTLLAPPGGV